MLDTLRSRTAGLLPALTTASARTWLRDWSDASSSSGLRERMRGLATTQVLDASPVVAMIVALVIEAFAGFGASGFLVAGILLLVPGVRWVTCAAAAALVIVAGSSTWSMLLAVYAAVYVCRRRVDGLRSWAAPAAAAVASVLGVRSDPVQVWMYTGNPPVAAALGIAVGVSVAELARTYGARERLEREAAELREQSREREEHAAWMDQRTRLARELHDVVGHHVTAMVVQAEAGLARDSAQATTSLHRIADLGRSALGDLDAMVHALREPGESVAWTSAPRIADLPRLADPLEAAGVTVALHVQEGISLDEAQELTVYRIVQESLTNVLRHAEAGHAWVDVGHDGQHVHVRVSDDGVGPPAGSTHGSGLKGIDERVRALRGVWTCSRRPGGGTSVDVFLPVGTPVDTAVHARDG